MKLKSRLKYRRNLRRVREQERSLPNNDYWYVSQNTDDMLSMLLSGVSMRERLARLEDEFYDLDHDLAVEFIQTLIAEHREDEDDEF